jgi:hypothetical protein
MKTPPAPPYLLPPASAVSGAAWTGPDGTALPDRLDHWDPFTETEVFRTVEVDADSVRSACALDEGATFALVTSWWSSRTRLGAMGDAVELGTRGGVLRATLSLQVPGPVAGGRLDLRTLLVLRHPGSAPSLVSPKREGAVLWQEVSKVALEGAAARFPVAAINFAEAPRLPDTGGWALEWDVEDLDAPVLASLRLLVNVSNEVLLNSLRSGSPDPRSTVIRSFVTYDVARTLVHAALRSERFVDDPEIFEDESVGRMLFELLAMYWPGIPIKALATRLQEDPARLDVEIQAHLEVLE